MCTCHNPHPFHNLCYYRPPLSLTHRNRPASYKACYTTGYDYDVKLNPKTWGKR